MSETGGFLMLPRMQSFDFTKAGIGVTGWSKAWSQVAQGMMAASMAQVELARTLWANQPATWQQTTGAGTPVEIARHLLQTSWSNFELGVKGARRINDELAATMFAAAEAVLEGATPESEPKRADGIASAEPAPSVVAQVAEDARASAAKRARHVA